MYEDFCRDSMRMKFSIFRWIWKILVSPEQSCGKSYCEILKKWLKFSLRIIFNLLKKWKILQSHLLEIKPTQNAAIHETPPPFLQSFFK